jgi:hypothetical protein
MISFLSPSSFDTHSSEMVEQPIILKAKPLCLSNCLILVQLGSSNRVALIQASNPNQTTKLDKRVNAPSSSHFYSHSSKFQKPTRVRKFQEWQAPPSSFPSWHQIPHQPYHNPSISSSHPLVSTNNCTRELLNPFRYRKIL